MKSLTIFIAMLVVTLILNGPIQSYADPQLDTLVNIATNAQNNLNISISQISNVPDEITSLYNQGSNETNALIKAANTQDVASAKQHFLSAMNFFKATNDKINSLNATETNDQQRVDVIQLQSEITRLENAAATLQTVAVANHADFNFTQLDMSIQKAKQDLDADKIEDASQSIDTANQLINDTHNSLSEIAQQRTTDRAKDFTEKQIERFDKIDNNLNATQNPVVQVSNNTIPKTSSNQTSAENPQELIAKLKKLVSEGNVNEALQIIKSLDAYQQDTVQTNESTIQSQSQIHASIQNNTEPNPPPVIPPTIPPVNPSTPTIPSNVTTSNVTTTNPPPVIPSNVTTIHPSTIPSNVTTTNPLPVIPSNVTTIHPSHVIPPNIIPVNPAKVSSSNNTTSQSHNDRKSDKSFHVIPQESTNSIQPEKKHDNNHEKTQKNPKNGKRNHNS